MAAANSAETGAGAKAKKCRVCTDFKSWTKTKLDAAKRQELGVSISNAG